MPELGLGTVQFGSHYGVTNKLGRPSADEVGRIVDLALAGGIRTFDTAPAYGSEAVLGQALGERAATVRLVTKTAPEPDAVLATLERSLADLGAPAAAGLLVHHAGDLTRPDGTLLAEAMREARRRGLAERIGFSVYDPHELDAAGEVLEPDLVQLPLNLVDQRFAVSGTIERLAARGIEVHVRSAFLQGTLLARASDLPLGLTGLAPIVDRLERLAAEAGVSRLVAPLGFCLSTPGVSTVLVGVNATSELEQLLDAVRPELPLDPAEFASEDPLLVDPRRWS